MIDDRNDAMETELLRTFCQVARTGSFTKTAREMGYVQSTITSQLQALEKQLGVRLLDRLRTGAVLTDEGSRLLVHATAMLDLEARLVSEVPASEGGPAGRVRLLAPESLCAYRLPGLLSDLRSAAPDVRLTLAPAGTAEALASVRAGASEVVLFLEPAMAADDLCIERLGNEELVLVAAPGFEETESEQTWANLARHDALLLEEGCSYSDQFAHSLLTAGQPGSKRIRFGGIETIKRCVAAGLGFAVLPAVTVVEELSAGALVCLPGPTPPTPVVHMATLEERTVSPATRALLNQLVGRWEAE